MTGDVPDTAITAADSFTSVYGKLMTLTGHLSDKQMAALRELDGTLALAEHVMAGTPVGEGAHSTICGMIMNAYAAGAAQAAAAERERLAGRGIAAENLAAVITAVADVLMDNGLSVLSKTSDEVALEILRAIAPMIGAQHQKSIDDAVLAERGRLRGGHELRMGPHHVICCFNEVYYRDPDWAHVPEEEK